MILSIISMQHRLVQEFCWCAQILAPVQCARFMYYSYPYGMDMLSLMTCAAKEAGEPSTHALLRAVQPSAAGGPSHKLASIDWSQAKKLAFQ